MPGRRMQAAGRGMRSPAPRFSSHLVGKASATLATPSGPPAALRFSEPQPGPSVGRPRAADDDRRRQVTTTPPLVRDGALGTPQVRIGERFRGSPEVVGSSGVTAVFDGNMSERCRTPRADRTPFAGDGQASPLTSGTPG